MNFDLKEYSSCGRTRAGSAMRARCPLGRTVFQQFGPQLLSTVRTSDLRPEDPANLSGFLRLSANVTFGYFRSSTTTDFGGSVAFRLLDSIAAPVNAAGFTTAG